MAYVLRTRFLGLADGNFLFPDTPDPSFLSRLATALPAMTAWGQRTKAVFAPTLGFTNRVVHGSDTAPWREDKHWGDPKYQNQTVSWWTPWLMRTAEPADGVVVDEAGVVVAITVADCPIVCLTDGKKLAVLHASRACVLRADPSEPSIIASAMDIGNFDPARTSAWAGHGIGACCYGLDVVPPNAPAKARTKPTRGPRANKPLSLDLRAVIADQLSELGIPAPQIGIDGTCTSCASESGTYRYWSRVRAEADGQVEGRNLFLAWLGDAP